LSKKPKLTSVLVLLLAFFTLGACSPPGDDYGLAPLPSASNFNDEATYNPTDNSVQGNGIVQSGSVESTATRIDFILTSSAAEASTQEAKDFATAQSQTQTARVPTVTVTPSPTRIPSPTATRTPTQTVTPTEVQQVQAIGQDCSQEGGGRQKLRIENNTGSPAVLYLNGENSYVCTIANGVQKIFVVSGSYNISALMCNNQLFRFGRHVINPTWIIALECP
jgi:uncharacterized lipoprotein YajG